MLSKFANLIAFDKFDRFVLKKRRELHEYWAQPTNPVGRVYGC